MPIHVASEYARAEHLARRATAPSMDVLKGSSILAIAQQVGELRAAGRTIHNLTIGDFNPKLFPIPPALVSAIQELLAAGETNYPPAVGVPELREAVTRLYARELGLNFPVDSVIVGSGARPPIYAAFRAIVEPGDTVVFPVPSWNVEHYVALNGGVPVRLITRPEDGFMPTAEQLAPHLSTARLLVINSPQNPSGTVIDEALLGGLCDAILTENARREAAGERPLMLLYDAVYWQLVFDGATHLTPIGLRPEMAPYTIIIDAISKAWAATGLRVGWGIAPPWVVAKMKALIGHMGAWAARAEQLATAKLLADPALLGSFLPDFKQQIRERLSTLANGIGAMQNDGLPVRCLPVQGAIYLSLNLDVHGLTTAGGRTLETDEDIRNWLLEEAGIAVVPFTAFGYPERSGWMRMSVGSVSMAEVQATLDAMRSALSDLKSS